MNAIDVAANEGREATRARYPDDEGYVDRDGVRIFYEVYGDGEPTVFFLPTWSVVHSRIWKAQIAYFARHFRVLTMDGRGNGRSDRPPEPAAYEPQEFYSDAIAVMDATGTERAVTVSLSAGTAWNLILGAFAPERVLATVFVGPTVYAVSGPFPEWSTTPYNERFDSYDGFTGQNRYFIRDHYREFAEWWSGLCTPEPHSTRPIEFAVEMFMCTTPEVIVATLDASQMDQRTCSAERLEEAGQQLRPLAQQLRCPALVIQGVLDGIALPHWARALAEDARAELVMIEDAGHTLNARKPVRFNLALREFVDRLR